MPRFFPPVSLLAFLVVGLCAPRPVGATDGVEAPAYLGPPGPWHRLGLPAPDLSPGAWAAYEVRVEGSEPGRFEVVVPPDPTPEGWRALELRHAADASGIPGRPSPHQLRLKLLLAPGRAGGWQVRTVAIAAPGEAPLPLAPDASAGAGPLPGLPGTHRATLAGVPARGVWVSTPAGRFPTVQLVLQPGDGVPLVLWVATDGRAAPFHVVRSRQGQVETRLVAFGGDARAALPPLDPPSGAYGTGRDQAKEKPSR